MLKKITAIMLIAGMAVSTLEVYAASTSKKIEETQGQNEETKGEL